MMSRTFRVWGIPGCAGMIALASVAACAQGRAVPDTAKSFDAALLKEQQRRIASFDSAVRMVNTDSAYRLWRAMLTAPDVRKGQLAVMCEIIRLQYRHGRAADVAIDRMNDTLWRGADPAAVQRLDAGLSGESPQIGRDTCAPYPSQQAPYWLVHWTVYDLPKLPPSPDSNPSQR
jgi:hypothetical protein